MTGLKQFVLHQLHEIRREMLVAIDALSSEDLTAHDPHGRSPIAWIIEHCCANFDHFAVYAVTGAPAVEHDRRFTTWPIIEPQPGDPYPPLPELISRWETVCDAAIAAIESLPEEALQQPGPATTPERKPEPMVESCLRVPEPMVESCLRVINHQNSHLRQIWCIIGWRQIGDRYPDQQTWLAATHPEW